MTVKTKRISTLIESQLPEFIATEYELFGKFIQKYYESQEVQGGPLDVITNIQKYSDIDFYEKNILKQNDKLAVSISSSDTTITLNDATSFPKKDGYVRIENEIIFYRERTDTQLLDCVRGVSGNTTLGDLYDESNFVSTNAAAHNSNKDVFNISNLFLYAFVKNFENQYLGSFPEKYLRGEVDKRTLIKNINKFYKAKGTDSSIKFIFNTIVSKDPENKPSVYKPRDFTYKSSESDWVNVYALKVKIISGDPKNLIGKQVVQQQTEEYGYASATVDNVYPEGTLDSEKIWNIVLAPETVNGLFAISTKTRLEKDIPNNFGIDDRVDVFSTIGWESIGEILIGEEVIEFSDKNVSQFIIKKRGQLPPEGHKKGASVYKPVVIDGSGASLLTLGVVYNIEPQNPQPYASSGDKIQISSPGFETADAKITLPGTNQLRWILNTGSPVTASTNIAVQNSLSGVNTDVAAIFADEQYYYIASSSYPSYNIFDGAVVDKQLKDQKILRIIRKESIDTTEIYETPKRDVGILLNGVPVYGYRDNESIRYGKLEEIKVNTQGRNYAKPPFVLVDGLPNKARAVLSGQVVDNIVVDTDEIFVNTPKIEIVSGRKAQVRAIVTGGRITSLVIDNPGEYYSSPPIIRIRDLSGRGRFAEYNSIVDTDGKLVDFEKINEGNFYNQENVLVEVLAVGEDATGTPFLKEWNKNRYEKIKNSLDKQNGYFFANIDNVLEYGYGHVANPKALRIQLNDNLNGAETEPTIKTHSPIIGFAYDGNPIYGPFGHENPFDSGSPIIRMTSSYSINGSRQNGPSTLQYPLGTFVDDYTYTHKSGTLDQNNGRFCITPDFPEGVYAYFITIDENQKPKFPYILGKNFYSLPVDSNYNSLINQNDIPKKSKRFSSPDIPRNGDGVVATITEVKTGGIDRVFVERSSDNFSVNSKLFFDNEGTEGSNVESLVSSIKGKPVSYLQSKENKVVKLTTIQNAYLFTDDILRQPSSGASGQIVGTVQNDNVIVLKDVIGTFDNTGTFSADTKTFIMVLDQDSSYTKGAILSLTDGINPPIATGEVLEGTSRQNTVQIKVLTGTWIIDDDYYLQSNDLFNTAGTKITVLTSLSDNLEPFEVNQSVALVETTENHGLGVGDQVVIDITPDDSTKTKTYYLRKRLYQKVKLRSFQIETNIDYSGVGKFTILNGGADYTPGTYSDVPLKGGSGTGAVAVITVSDAGVVSNIQIEEGGIDYRRGDFLSVDDDELARSGASLSSSRLTLYIDHAGVAAGSSKIKVKSANKFAEGDLLQVGNEIVEISSITGSTLNVFRGKEGTETINHFDKQIISLYKPRYNFTPDFQITNAIGSGYIQSYDLETQEAEIVYDYSIQKSNAIEITNSTSFFDASTPQRLVSVASVSDVKFKFEFSEDNISFTPNPVINIQEFYKYKFDTSHSSLTGTYFDLSPSKGFNLLTLEKISSTILPGNTGSFTDVKFGFGSRLIQNNYSTKKGTNFTNFYYFDKKNVVDAEGSYLKIITDPLQGNKIVNYVTPNRFVYDLPSEPLWDGSGSIRYTTSGQFAIGEIDKIKIVNSGGNYKKLPVILGCAPTNDFTGKATVLFDDATKQITEVRIDDVGKNYVNPTAVITDGDGFGAKFKVVQVNGKLFSITIENPGYNYTYAPTIEIIESDVKLYAEGDNIGIPRSISITKNGGAFHLDETVSSNFTSKYTVSLTAPEQTFGQFVAGITPTIGKFKKGEIVIQKSYNNNSGLYDGPEVMRARVAEFREGTNLLKLESVTGIIREDLQIVGLISTAIAKVKSVYVSTLKENITSFFDNIGYYTSDKGKLGVANQKLTDSFFYQDYSYVIQSKTSIEQWRDLIKSTTHPAGFKLFGQVDIEASANTEMPSGEKTKASTFTTIQLWDPQKNRITSDIKQRVITQTVQKVENTRIRKGIGSASSSEFNFNESRAFEFTLTAPFDGYFDTDGRLQGTTMFQMRDKFGNAFFPVSAESLIVTLDGIIQEPKVAYTVSQDKIIFSQPPLGPGQKLTGNNGTDLSEYNGTTFYGRCFFFKNNQYNNRYIRKIRNIFQRNGRWLDAANQIDRNKEFIVTETIGYGKEKYPNLDWSTKLDDYTNDIGYVLDSYDHDLRFGGNAKVVDYASIFYRGSSYITNNKEESLDIFNYATRLSRLAVRNWDYVDNQVSYIQGSKKVTVSSTRDLAIGMHISSGKSFAAGTKIVSIDDINTITVSTAALANSGSGPGGVAEGETPLSGSTSGDFIIPTSTGVVEPGNTFSVSPGDELIVPLSFSGSDSATFFFSGITSGTFYDAANLIEANKEFIAIQAIHLAWDQEFNETGSGNLNWLVETNLATPSIKKYIDACVYHLRFGGNAKVVEHYIDYPKEAPAFTNPSVDVSPVEVIYEYAYQYARDLMIQAMRNQLSGSVPEYFSELYPDVVGYSDPSVATDSSLPLCADVESALNTFHEIIEIVRNPDTVGQVLKVPQNPNISGNWSSVLPYSNYNIIGDPLLTNQECSDVISSIDSLYTNFDDVLNGLLVDKTTPDYIDGETKAFDLYWENGDPVVSEEDENLFITINAVLQETKFNESYPGDDSYYINRTVVPNQLVFDVAPIWDQDAGAKTLGEPTAVEKVSGVGVGNYKRLTIDDYLIDNVRSGPFIILDLEDLTVQNVEQSDYLFVFIDGVLQREGISYEVSGPNIFFKFPITEQMKIDMRYFYGRDVGQILNIYDYNPNTYYAKAQVTLEITSGLDVFLDKKWSGPYTGGRIHAVQIRPDGTYNVIGEIVDYNITGNTIKFSCFGYKCELDETLDVTFITKENYQYRHTFTVDYTNSSITYETDEEGRLLLSGNDFFWRGTNYRKSYRNPFINLSNNSKIRVEGEDGFRNIKELPSVLTSKEERLQKQVSNSLFGQVNIASYNGITRGEGLSIVAVMETDVDGNLTGRIERLEWNQRSYDPITQPTAYQYFTPPVVNFVPENGFGGGAKATVLVSKGQVISVDLIDPGSGYTKAPNVIVARRYDVLEDSDIGVSVITAGINPAPLVFNLISSSTIDVLGNQISGVNTFTSILFRSPIGSDRVITAEIQLVEECGQDLSGGLVKPILKIDDQFNRDTLPIETTYAGTEISAYIATPADLLRIYSESRTLTMAAERQITTSINNIIQNNALSNINYYEVAALLDVQLDIGETIVYIADTSKFKSNGYLLIGNEVVRYMRKINDRFLMVQRAQNGTTEQTWPAGTYLRQIPDLVSVAPAGIVKVESESQVMVLKGGPEIGGVERKVQEQIVLTNDSVKTASRVIELEIQPQINVESISSVQTRVLYKLEPALENVQSFDTLHKETQVKGQLLKQIEEFYTFDISQTIVNVAVRPTITSTSEVIILTDVISFVHTEPLITAFSTFEHKETFITKFRDQFDALLGIISFEFNVTETVVNVAVSPTITSTSQVSIETESVTISPYESFVEVNSLRLEETAVLSELQTVHSEFTITKQQLEVLLIPPPSGVIDGYEESVFIDDPISTRLNGLVDLDDSYEVIKRDGTSIFVVNAVSGVSSSYIGNYTTTNAGYTIGAYNGIYDDGASSVSGLSILELSLYYPSLTINDFVERKDSSYTLAGSKFILLPPSIQNPVTNTTSGIDINGEMDVMNTTYFPDAGYLAVEIVSGAYSGTISIISYTGKTATTFTGCALFRGQGFPTSGCEVMPFSID